MVAEELREDLIITGFEAKTSSDIFRAIGQKMTDLGYTKDTYVDALIEREVNFPTGLDIGDFGIAIPHTAKEHVNEAITGIVTLKEPVDFVQLGTADEHVGVNVVFVLAVKDPNAHLEYLQQVVKIFQNKEVMQSILDEKDPKKIIEIIKKEEGK